MELYQITLIIAVVFGFLELFASSFVFLSFALSIAFVALVQYLDGNLDINRDLIIFSIGSIFFTVLFRALFRGRKDTSAIGVNRDVNRY